MQDSSLTSTPQFVRGSASFQESNQSNEDGPLKRRSSEMPLFFAVAAASLLIWLVLAVSIIGIVYAVMLGVFFYFSHVMFVTYLRGSAVKVSQQQFPELHQRLQHLSQKMGLKRVPDFYLTQADGSLNALATRFHRSDMIVLFSDLLEACEGNDAARDFIICHELAHLKARHLRWWLLTLPGQMVPFLGSAYSRAREYTADSWGHAISGGGSREAQGLVILSVGGKLAKSVNLTSFLEQQTELTGAMMTIGRWLSTYPTLSERLAALTPANTASATSASGKARALVILALVGIIPIFVTVVAVAKVGHDARAAASAIEQADESGAQYDQEADE